MAATTQQRSWEDLNSHTIQHVVDYPVVNDIGTHLREVRAVQALFNVAFGVSSWMVTRSWPLIRFPCEMLKPYALKADEIGDRTLTRIDERFPAVKKPTDELYTDLREGVLQYHAAQTLAELHEHIMKLYGEEYKKAGGEGLPTAARSAVATSLLVGAEAVGQILNYLSQKRQEGEGIIDGASEKVRQAVDEAREAARGAKKEANNEAQDAKNDTIDGNWD